MRKKVKKNLLLSICCLLLFLFGNTIITNAATTFHKGDLINGVYFENVGNTENWITWKKYDGNGNVAYCLNRKLATPDGLTYYLEGEMNEKVFRILKNGYPTISILGYGEVDYYITQCAIWCLMEGRSNVDDLIFYGNTSAYPNATEREVKWQIAKLVGIGNSGSESSTSINLNFNNSNVKAYLNSDGYFYTDWLNINAGIGDNVINGVGEMALRISGNTNGVVIQNTSGNSINQVAVGEKFRIKIPKSNPSGSLTITSRGVVIGHSAIQWGNSSYDGVYQKIVTFTDKSAWNESPKNSTEVTWDLGMANIKIIKNDNKGKPLAGAKFEIFNSGGVSKGTFITGIDGTISINELTYDTYTIKEIEAPKGYLLDSTTHNVVLSEADKTYEVTITNNIKKGDVELEKIDSETKDKLKGAVFELYKEDNTFLGEYTTDDEGKILITDLEYGKYYFKEKVAPEGYLLNYTSEPFSIVENGKKVKVTARNSIKKGSVELEKIDSETKDKLKDAVFELFKADDTLLGEYTTNEEGKIKINKLRYGDYYLKEKKAPEGYLLNESKYPFSIKENKQVINLEAENNRIKAKIKIYKLDNDTYKITEDEQVQEIINAIKGENDTTSNYTSNEIKDDIEDDKGTTVDNKISTIDKDLVKNIEGLEGVKFKLECLEGFHKGEVQELTSLKDGLDLELEYGKYRLTEVQTIDGYILNTEPIEFSISKDGKEYLIQKGNDRIKGKMKVLKIDGKTNAALEGATFKLTCLDGFDKGKEIIFTSKSEGNEFDLEYGKYQLQEIEAPEGYLLYDKIMEFEVTEDNQEFSFSVPNDPIEIEIKTSDKINYIVYVLSCIISTIIVIYIVKLRRKRDENLE